MVVFDRDGKFVRSWGRQFRGVAHGLRDPARGIRQSSSTSRSTPRIRGCRRRPRCRPRWSRRRWRGRSSGRSRGRPTRPPTRSRTRTASPKRYNPTNVAIAPNGDIYVGDGYGSYFINQYNGKGEYHPHVRRPWIGAGAAERAARASGSTRARRARRSCVVAPIAATTGCSASRSTARTWTSSPASGCRATSTSGRERSSIPDLHGRVTLLDRDNRIVQHLGDSNAATWNNPLRSQPRDAFIAGAVHLPARRLLRSRRQHLRRRVGRSRPRDEVAESVRPDASERSEASAREESRAGALRQRSGRGSEVEPRSGER